MRIRTKNFIKEIDEIRIHGYTDDDDITIEVPINSLWSNRISVPQYIVNDLLSKGYADLSNWL